MCITYISLPSPHDYDGKMPNFTFCGECEHKTMSFFLFLAPVVQTVDSAIQRINRYPVDSAIVFPNTYPLDSDLSGG